MERIAGSLGSAGEAIVSIRCTSEHCQIKPAPLRWLDALVYPPCCVLCGAPGDGADLCRPCRAELPFNTPACPRCALPSGAPGPLCGRCIVRPPPWDTAVCAFVYAWPVDAMLVGLKFAGRLAYGQVLGELLAAAVSQHRSAPPDLLVPVPLHPQREARRGFNQARELALPAVARFDCELGDALCARSRATPPQTGLSAGDRARNVRGCFAVAADLSGRHVAIVDDVMTTGATARELHRTLCAAGAARVDVWSAARALPPRKTGAGTSR